MPLRLLTCEDILFSAMIFLGTLAVGAIPTGKQETDDDSRQKWTQRQWYGGLYSGSSRLGWGIQIASVVILSGLVFWLVLRVLLQAEFSGRPRPTRVPGPQAGPATKSAPPCPPEGGVPATSCSPPQDGPLRAILWFAFGGSWFGSWRLPQAPPPLPRSWSDSFGSPRGPGRRDTTGLPHGPGDMSPTGVRGPFCAPRSWSGSVLRERSSPSTPLSPPRKSAVPVPVPTLRDTE